jgi:dipeptidyl aminopeptidase/acylaminoacyl peptidase
MKIRFVAQALLGIFVSLNLFAQIGTPAPKPRIGFDEFFNAVEYTGLALAPDGKALLIGTKRADWQRDRYRKDIWLWRDGYSAPMLLTTSGHDWDAQWSPDGKWIAFLSDRPTEPEPEEAAAAEAAKPAAPAPAHGRDADSDEEAAKKPVPQLFLISASGGEAFPVTSGLEEVHAFAWAADSQSLYFATRIPWSKEKREAYKNEWKDVEQYREAERGDVIARIAVADAVARQAALAAAGSKPARKSDAETAETPGAVLVTSSEHSVKELAVSPDGRTLAFLTGSVSGRIEGVAAYEIYLVPAAGGAVRRLTNNQALEEHLHWTPDSRAVLFSVQMGSVEAKYEDVQTRVYAGDAASGAVQRWASAFGGSIGDWGLTPDGALVAAGRLGTEVPVYAEANAGAPFRALASWPGTYQTIATAKHSPRVAVVYSALDKPTEVYLADSAQDISHAVPVTSFNKLFTERALPQGRPYTWKADDGTTVEGMLIYPPGQFGARNLRTFVLIHGGPEDADGNMFGADWYDWAILAASDGYLVFRPNYRGSTGYGDTFMRQIVPQIVSRPGRDILEGVDALVRDGIADPDRLTIGGYSYGGYMTNWLITQTTRFKAAVTGAGAIEHAANWGNDDLSFDDAWFLGGNPWEAEKNYNDEAALWQIEKVKTPTHMVAGGDDVRVAVEEDYLLERALHTLGVPSSLLIFPGEGHSLAKNPWHGKIKVREELKWLEKYGGAPAAMH